MSTGMPLSQVHILLTYRCLYECPHCFVHSGPGAPGSMTVQEVEGLVEQAATIDGVRTIYFEGGEPAIYYPTLLAGVRRAGALGLDAALVTCGYFATTVPEGEHWLRALREAGLRRLEVSIDELHGTGEAHNHARNLVRAAEGMGLPVQVLSVCAPVKDKEACEEAATILLRGRAAKECVEGLEMRPWTEFVECSFEDLEAPERVHVDPYGNVFVCQGILVGNVWESSLPQIVGGYAPREHHVVGPLLEGGPAALVRAWLPDHDGRYASECHTCYEIRRVLRAREPKRLRPVLGPSQVYGEEPDPPPTSYK